MKQGLNGLTLVLLSVTVTCINLFLMQMLDYIVLVHKFQ